MAETNDVTLPVLVAVSALPGGLFYRVNCGNFRTLDGRRVVRSTSVDGVADIMGVLRGVPVAVETKIAGGRQRETQLRFQVAWERAGGVYIIARSPEEALAALAAL